MAKPIAPTPVLRGDEAVEFLLEMEKPTSDEKRKLLNQIKKEHDPDLF